MKIKSTAALGIALATPSLVYGLGLRVPDQDTHAVARGNAFAATADNPSAIYYNPAGIAQLDGHQTRSSIYLIDAQSTYASPTGAETKSREKIQAVPQFYYTYGNTNWPVSLGLGVYSPYGLGLEWPKDVAFRQAGISGKMEYISFQPVLAWKAHPTLSFGAGPSMSYGKVDLRRGITPLILPPPLPKIPLNPNDQFRFDGDDWNLAGSVGVLWKPHEKHAFGLVYRTPSQMDFSGDVTYHDAPALLALKNEKASAKVDFPQQIVVGYSFRPTPKWNLEFNFDWTDWDTLNDVTVKTQKPMVMPFNYQSSALYEWGVTRCFEKGWSVSGGYMYSQNSVPNASFNPSVPDSDRHLFSVGVGKQFEHLRCEAAYQLAYGPDRDINLGANNPVTGQYSFLSHAIALSLGYAF